jgi:hypothetical protein
MKAILSSVLMIAFVIGGVVSADVLKSSGEPAAAETHGDEKNKDGKDAKKKADKGKKDKSKKDKGKDKKSDKGKKDKKKGKKKDGKGGDYGSASDVSYFQFSRQFVVPVVDSGSVQALVLLDINLELEGDQSATVYTMEPKLRDAVMRSLISLSHKGVFGDEFTNPEVYDLIRETIHDATTDVVPSGVRDVLILDIARQDR